MRTLAGCLALFLLFAVPAAAASKELPRPSHVIVVIEENHDYKQVIGSTDAPYLNFLASHGANFTNSRGITHPSAPNYFALFSGHIITNGDDCPEIGVAPDAPNIGTQLLAARDTYAAYSESLPKPGFMGCDTEVYARKHAPWVHFTNLPPDLHQPFSAFPQPGKLPTVAFVVPNINNDMHDGTVKQGDDWLAKHLAPYVRAAGATNTLIIVIWDEGYDQANSIPTIFYGPMVKPGNYADKMNAYAVLRTIEDMYGLAPLGHAAEARTPADAFR